MMLVQPYLCFEGCCEEALHFYRDKLNATVDMLMRFKDAPASDAPQPPEGCAGAPADPDKVLHATFRIGDAVLMASDGMASGKPNFQGMSLSLQVADLAEAERVFTALSDGGQVQVPLAKTFFSPAFGMVADRFGVSWMVVVEDPGQTTP
jgi:PhnB protein